MHVMKKDKKHTNLIKLNYSGLVLIKQFRIYLN